MTKQVQITDAHELQNLLDDYSPDRPYLNVYCIDGGIFADEAELDAWRRKGKITTPPPHLPAGVTLRTQLWSPLSCAAHRSASSARA